MRIIADDIYQLDKDIKDTLDSIIVGLELTTNENFYYTKHSSGERSSSYRKYYSFRRKHYFRDVLFEFYILSNLTLKIEINDGSKIGSVSNFYLVASLIEELFDFEVNVRGNITDIYLEDYSELPTVVNILMKYCKFDR